MSVTKAQARKAATQRQPLSQIRGKAPLWLKETWEESIRRGTDKLTMKQIDAEIATHRREKRAKESKQPK